MGAPFKPSKLATLPSPVALLLGVLLGLSLLPVLKSLLGAQFLNSTCVSLCPQGGADKAHAAQGPGAAFASFVYPTWPVREVPPTVSARREVWQPQRRRRRQAVAVGCHSNHPP